MNLWLLIPLIPLSFAFEISKTHGVAPQLLKRYTPSEAHTWRCLDGSREIPWTAVNDDYCDCLDGSDEPGTGACPNSTFFCKNVGHIGATIPSSHVRDGLCEPECCDGSDELEGVCENTCREVGEVHRAKVEAERKLRKTGSKIRSSYIAFAKKEKTRLEGVIITSQNALVSQEKEVARLKDIVDRTEALSAEALERKKQSPLYIALVDQANALKSLQHEHKKLVKREQALSNILDTLRRGYNPNYQDMAVLEAVRGWEYLAKLPHIGQEELEEGIDEEEVVEAELEEGMWSAEELENNLDALLQTDYLSLLLEHDKHSGAPPVDSILKDVAAYLPDALVPHYQALRDIITTFLWGSFKAGTSSDVLSSDAAKAKEALSNAERDLSRTQKELSDAKQDLDELFNPEFFGSQGEWRKLAHQCLSKDTGDYTYEVCLFGEAKQKPNGGGQTFSLGHYSGWNDEAEIGSPEYYSRQMYTLGTKCWNGPQRSVRFDLVCGTENILSTVQELEKCEYLFTGTTPALCLPLDTLEPTIKEEL